jgi:CO/xanthine dehydrogenase FAD-binding subunit
MFLRPRSLEEAVGALARDGGVLLSGGTDLFPAWVDRLPPAAVIDLSAVTALRGIRVDINEVRIGGGTTWSDIIRADLPPAFAALQAAGREVGSVQIQNAGTIAGNLCNASPAADGVPPLLALEAEVELVSVGGVRRLPLAAFITGYRATGRRADEILSAVIVPRRHEVARSAFLKLGARRYLVISIVMVAVNLRRGPGGEIVHARVAVGAASAVARRLESLERKLQAARARTPAASVADDDDLAPLTPIDDVRATAVYRRDAALTLVRRALEAADA